MEKTYLGDGVYVRRDDFGGVVLTTEDGIRATNSIVMEPEVLLTLFAWLHAQGPEVLDRFVAAAKR